MNIFAKYYCSADKFCQNTQCKSAGILSYCKIFQRRDFDFSASIDGKVRLEKQLRRIYLCGAAMGVLMELVVILSRGFPILQMAQPQRIP